MAIYKGLAAAMPLVVAFGLCPVRHHLESAWTPEVPEHDFSPGFGQMSFPSAGSTGVNSMSGVRDVTVGLTGVGAIGQVGTLGPSTSVHLR